MTRNPPLARTTTRRSRWLLVVGLIVVIAVITAALGYQVPKSFSSSSPSAAAPSNTPRSEHRGALGEADGVVPDGGVEFVTSGWRSPEYQDQLLREAVSKYGSEEEAARWVATAATSPHVSGDAIDIGHSHATAWLSKHGAEYGLRQIYKNEPWRYELRSEAIDRSCPRKYADPTQDPRMQQ